MSNFVADVAKTKLDVERKNMRVAGKFTEWTFKKIADEVETIIEDDKHVKHSYIQNKIEKLLEDQAIE